MNSVQLLLLGLPTSTKTQSYKGFTFISCLELLLEAVAGKHPTNTVKGAIRGTFCRGRFPSKVLEEQEGDTKQNSNLQQ